MNAQIKKVTLALGMILVATLNITLASDLSFTDIVARGSGCPAGSTDIVTSPDGKSVSLLFNEMLIELPQYNGENENDVDTDGHRRASRFDKNISQKICNILVEAQLPANHKVDRIEVKMDMRGSTFMDEGVEASFHTQLINYKGPKRQNDKKVDFVARKLWLSGPVDEDWIVSKTRNIRINGNCSRHGDQKSQFAIRNILRGSIKPEGQRLDSMLFLGLDSQDLVGKLDVTVHSSPCGGRVTRPSRPSEPRKPTGPTRPSRGGPQLRNCSPGLIFHRPANRCMTKREMVLWDRGLRR